MIVGGFIALVDRGDRRGLRRARDPRGRPHRRDNVMFGLLALTDAAMTAWRGVNVLSGGSIIVDASVPVPCAIGTIVMALLSMEFIVELPAPAARCRWRWRARDARVGAASRSCDRGAHEARSRTSIYVDRRVRCSSCRRRSSCSLLGARAWRRTTETATRAIVIAMLGFRWVVRVRRVLLRAAARHLRGRRVWAETTFATLVSFVVIGTAVLRTELFSIRSAAAEVVTIATIAFTVAARRRCRGDRRQPLRPTPGSAPGRAARRRDVRAARARRARARAVSAAREAACSPGLDERRAPPARRPGRAAARRRRAPRSPRRCAGSPSIGRRRDGDAGSRPRELPARARRAAARPASRCAATSDRPARCFVGARARRRSARSSARSTIGRRHDRSRHVRRRARPRRARRARRRASRRRSPSSRTRAGSPRSASSPPRSRTTSARR